MSVGNSIEAPKTEDVNADGSVGHPQTTDNPSTNEQAPSSESQNSKDYNWGQARKELKELQRQNLELQTQVSSLQTAPEENQSETDDEWLTTKEVRKLVDKEIKKRDMSMLDDRVKMRYSNYYSVVNEDNLEKIKSDPLLGKVINGLKDPFDRACFLYEHIKLKNGGEDYSPEQQQIEENISKPRSTNSLGPASPLHMARDYSKWPNKDLKSTLYKEMVEAAKGA